MQTIKDLNALRAGTAAFRAAGETIALVPTMGALHAGHMALVAEARRRADRVAVSIFVNPKQFGPNEDLAKYPRREATDSAMLADGKVDLLWLPPVEVMYPAGFMTNVSVAGVSEGYDGAARPGHFDGVATVVSKLFNQVRPDIALFGEKDFQQLAVIRRMVTDLNMGLEIIGVPTQRDDDGLALSSRNVYLSPEERAAAVALPRALGAAKHAIEGGQYVDAALETARTAIRAAGFTIDYVELADAATLGAPITGQPMRLLAAARIGTTRLIDNIGVNEQG